LATKVPGFILVAVRNGEMAFAGFGAINDRDGKAPDANTMFRIGSVSKVFCGDVLASMVLDGKLRFEDRLQDRLRYDVKLPGKGRARDPPDRSRHAILRPAAGSAARGRTARRSLCEQHQASADREPEKR